MDKILEHKFIQRHEVHKSMVENSHNRSSQYGIKKDTTRIKNRVTGEELQEITERNNDLLQISQPFVENLYNYVKDTGFFLEVIDKNGIILSIIGDASIVKRAADMNMCVGTDVSEKSAGTNAISLALQEDCPIQLVGEEHYLQLMYGLTCSCAVIHNEEGQIIGCVNLTGWAEGVNKHTLALVVAAVRSIENQIKVNRKQKELIEAYNYTSTIINSIDIGILAISSKGEIKLINHEACKITNLNKEEAIGKDVFSIIEKGLDLKKLLDSGKKIENKEISIFKGNIERKLILSVHGIFDKKQSIAGTIFILKDIKEVVKLVNQYVGMTAKYDFDMIIGESPKMLQVKEYAKKVSDSPSTILIQGESGTGKELLAQAIHNNSRRRQHGFVALNCGAIPSSLIESELFGYVEGAFTGAKKGGYTGKIALADKGTLFLDEIGEMPLHMQVHLLRVLQEGKITRLGDNKSVKIDVRIIAATNKDLKEEVKKGRFREDLYYRLRVIPIHLPPLRERDGDIEILIDYYLRNKAISLDKEIPKISYDLYNKLLLYRWPGNIRELENSIENIVNFNGDLSFDINCEISDNKIEKEIKVNKMDRLKSLVDWEKEAIMQSLKKNNNNFTMTAKVLGMSRTTLYSKMKKYKIGTVQ